MNIKEYLNEIINVSFHLLFSFNNRVIVTFNFNYCSKLSKNKLNLIITTCVTSTPIPIDENFMEHLMNKRVNLIVGEIAAIWETYRSCCSNYTKR